MIISVITLSYLEVALGKWWPTDKIYCEGSTKPVKINQISKKKVINIFLTGPYRLSPLKNGVQISKE